MDLRAFIDRVRAAGELQEIRKEVSPDRELGAVLNACERSGKAAFFHAVKGHQIPVVGALLSSPSRIALALDCAAGQVGPRMAAATEQPVKYEVQEDAPCREVVIEKPDLARWPIPTH